MADSDTRPIEALEFVAADADLTYYRLVDTLREQRTWAMGVMLGLFLGNMMLTVVGKIAGHHGELGALALLAFLIAVALGVWTMLADVKGWRGLSDRQRMLARANDECDSRQAWCELVIAETVAANDVNRRFLHRQMLPLGLACIFGSVSVILWVVALVIG